ncbi:hypothetical protein C2S51_010433 [Perilla frutescens var. frutescens]|nr:hypothetical protein C2S51_010433 [Perilla frutescens var. frutescens]
MVCEEGSNLRLKTCRLHSVFWHLSNSEAVKNKFFRALNTRADGSTQEIESQRRLCIRNSILLCIKDVHNSIASMSSVCSLLFTGPPHQYPVPIDFGLRLIKVLDALAIRLYEFPVEVVKLIHLRYLALTCNGKIPAFISKLWSLEFLIVSQHLSIKADGDWPFLPVEIWDMKELKHVQVTGSNLPKPNCGTVLPNLLTLLDVGAQSCCEEVLKGIPNLKRLGIQIESAPDDNGRPSSYLSLVSRLQVLESFKYVVVNPELSYEAVSPLTRVSMFPLGLKKLTLSGLGYPWEFMSIVCELQNLEVLKLRCYALQGPEWVTDYLNLNKVKYLSIEDTDLVRWKLNSASFANLESLCIKHCYKLEDLPCAVSNSVKKIEVVDCNPLVVAWAKQMKNSIKVQIYSSWDDESLNY